MTINGIKHDVNLSIGNWQLCTSQYNQNSKVGNSNIKTLKKIEKLNSKPEETKIGTCNLSGPTL